jgi:hypothetical protein
MTMTHQSGPRFRSHFDVKILCLDLSWLKDVAQVIKFQGFHLLSTEVLLIL